MNNNEIIEVRKILNDVEEEMKKISINKETNSMMKIVKLLLIILEKFSVNN